MCCYSPEKTSDSWDLRETAGKDQTSACLGTVTSKGIEQIDVGPADARDHYTSR